MCPSIFISKINECKFHEVTSWNTEKIFLYRHPIFYVISDKPRDKLSFQKNRKSFTTFLLTVGTHVFLFFFYKI